jgi:hypothetical protein
VPGRLRENRLGILETTGQIILVPPNPSNTAENQKATAQTSAAKRYEQFLAFVEKRMGGPNRLAIEVPPPGKVDG